MSVQVPINAYAVANGSVPNANNAPFVAPYSPSTNNINGPFGTFRLGQMWMNTTSGAIYMLTALSPSNGVMNAAWTPVSGLRPNSVTSTSSTGQSQNSFICSNSGSTTLSLPAASSIGDMMVVVGTSANTGGWVISQVAGQQIFNNTSHSTSGSGGSVSTAAANTSITLMCVVANLTWEVLSSTGTVTYT